MRKPYASALAIGATLLALAACNREPDVETRATLDEIRAAGELVVVTRNAPTTYYIDRHARPAGPEHDLVAAYAESLGVSLKVVVRETTPEVLAAVANGKAHIAAAGLSRLKAREQQVRFGPAYKSVTEQVVCRREGEQRARKRDQLSQVRLGVADGTSYVSTLAGLQAGEVPDLKFERIATGTEQLLRRVWDKELDCTVADSHLVSINRRYYPELVVEFDLGEPRELAWALHPDAEHLHADLERWMASDAARTAVAGVESKYFEPHEKYDFVDTRAFYRRLDQRYDKYDHWFEAAADEHGIDPVILAAQAYQESGWDPTAKSPTGVRGIMMLTRTTARELGVDDRLDPKQSIEGGAEYLAKLEDRFDDSIEDPDRLYLTLAAYNVGRAHMHDAQTLARKRGLDPHSWDDVRTVLPLLADKSVYPDLKYGYARGHEPVRYVDRIRNYADLMAQVER